MYKLFFKEKNEIKKNCIFICFFLSTWIIFSTFAPVIQIGRHIEILLLSNDCVIVPGFGGFVTHKVNARYDENDCIFLPPIRTLGFNPQLQINDSLLVISYVEAFDISYPEALRKIEAEVEELKQTLATEGSYEMNGIGTLYLNKEGTLVFDPCEAGVLTPDLYALSSFDFDHLPKTVTPVVDNETETGTEKVAPSLTAHIEPAKTEPKTETQDDDNDDDSNYIHISTAWMKAAVAAAAMLLVAIILISPNETVNRYYSHMSTWSTELIQKLMPKDTNTETLRIQPQAMPVTVKANNKKAQSETSANIKAETTVLKPETLNVKVVNEAIQISKNSYTIVLASSTTESNAKNYVKKLKNLGYNDAVVYDNGRTIRVVYGNFESEHSAQDSLRKLRAIKGFEEAWVLKIQN